MPTQNRQFKGGPAHPAFPGPARQAQGEDRSQLKQRALARPLVRVYKAHSIINLTPRSSSTSLSWSSRASLAVRPTAPSTAVTESDVASARARVSRTRHHHLQQLIPLAVLIRLCRKLYSWTRDNLGYPVQLSERKKKHKKIHVP